MARLQPLEQASPNIRRRPSANTTLDGAPTALHRKSKVVPLGSLRVIIVVVAAATQTTEPEVFAPATFERSARMQSAEESL